MNILVVEDDEIDQLTFKRALRDLKPDVNVDYAVNGIEALEMIRKHKKPDIIILDINTPVMNGLEFLDALHNNVNTKSIPKLVLTTSKNDAEITSCFKRHISGYFLKPIDFDEFVELIGTILEYWSKSKLLRAHE